MSNLIYLADHVKYKPKIDYLDLISYNHFMQMIYMQWPIDAQEQAHFKAILSRLKGTKCPTEN